MPKQLNVTSDEAFEVAHDLAQRLKKSTDEVAETALREYNARQPSDELTPEQKAFVDDIMALASQAAAAARPGATSDHSDFYDENGLPI